MRNLHSCNYTLVVLGILIVMVSCKPQNKLNSLIYFREKGDSLQATMVKDFEPVIKPGDRLSITISALDPASAAPFNLGTGSTVGTYTGYLVEPEGTIRLPQLGKKNVSGLTRKQLADQLSAEMVKFVNDPLVTVQFLNFKIIVLGEVTRPGTLTLTEGKINIVEAIGQAGDMTNYANRGRVMVIREANGKREFGYVSLLSKDIFNSPFYNLQQGDVVYIEPTTRKVEADQAFVRNLSIITTVISVVSTLVFLVLNLTK